MLRYPNFHRYSRLVDQSPLADVPCSVPVGVLRMSATLAPKPLAGAISPLGVSTLGACLRRVARIDRDQRDPGYIRLVGQEVAELRECPRAMSRPLRLTDLRPLADTLEVFNGETSTGIGSLPNQRLTNDVVHVPLTAFLATGKVLEFPLGRTSPFGLELLPELCVASPNFVHDLPGKYLSVGGRGDVADTEVHSEIVRGVLGVFEVPINNDVHVESIPLTNELRRARCLPSKEELPLVVAQQERSSHASANGAEGAMLGFGVDPERSSVKAKRVSLETMPPPLVPLVGFGNLIPSRASQLRWEPGTLTRWVVSGVVELDFAERLSLPRHCGDVLARPAVFAEGVVYGIQSG